METPHDLIVHTIRTGEPTYVDLHPSEFGRSVDQRCEKLESFLHDCEIPEIDISIAGSREALEEFRLHPGDVLDDTIDVRIGPLNDDAVRVNFMRASALPRPIPETD